jgi:hypothetical protein
MKKKPNNVFESGRAEERRDAQRKRLGLRMPPP